MNGTRRDLLKAVTAGGASLTILGNVTGIANAQPCDFSCDNIYVKYELVENDDGTCSFEEETDTGIFGDSLTITETKEGDSCEPITVSWDDADYVAGKVTAFGGDDCETVWGPSGSYDADPDRETEPDNDQDGGLDNNGGNVAAISNLQFCVEPAEPLECPSGTSPLARYDVEDGSFVFAGGEDVVTFSNVVTDGDCVKGFDFSSVDGADDNTEPEVLTTVTVEYGGNVDTWEVDPDFDVDKQSGTVDLTGQDDCIDTVLFCQAAYAQADFVEGDVISSFCDDDGNNIANYGSRKISSVTWSSYNGQLDGTQGQFDGSWIFHDSTHEIEVDYDPGVDYISDNGIDKVALAVYEVEDPEFRDNNNISFAETQCRQHLLDSDTDEAGDQDGTLLADLPMA